MSNKELTYDEALHKAAAYCSASEHCISELQTKFDQWNVQDDFREKIIRYLIKEKYIDEIRYAEAYAKDKFRYNKWGKIKIRMQLQARKIDQEKINIALDSIDETEYKDMIIRLLKEKEKNITYRNDYERTGKLFRYLAGKGFESELTIKILDIHK